MNGIINAALGRSRTVVLTLVILLFAGAFAYVDIPKENDPDISIPIIYVSMHLEGISPEDSERLLIRPMEQELSSIEGVKEMSGTGYQGGGNVMLEFTAGFDVDQALEDVREAVDKAKPELPEEADEPTVSEVNFSLFPVLVVTLSGDVPERTLLNIAKDLQDKIEALEHVLEAPITGDREELVEAIVDPVLIESYGLNGSDVVSFFNRSSGLIAAGNIDTGAGRFAVKVPGLFETVDDIRNMPLKVNGDAVVRVRDVAEIRRTYKDPNSFARLNGEKTLAIEVVKRTGENVIETIEKVREIVSAEKEYWPEGVAVTYTQDKSGQIRTMLSDLQNNVISAIVLVMIICVAAIGTRSALLVGIAIPGAFLSGVLVLYTIGLTVNVVVLFALILSVGLLVDGAIVVTEYADRRLNEGASRKTAYSEAAQRMSWPIIASTMTTLAAFFPLLFWPGIVGEFMTYLPLTLIAVLISSLFMALIFVPTLGSLVGKASKKSTPDKHEEVDVQDVMKNGRGLGKYYLRFLNLALKVPGIILIFAAVVLVTVQYFYIKSDLGTEFFPDIEPEQAVIKVHARGNLSIWEQDELVRQVELKVLDIPGIDTAYTRTGSSGQSGSSEAEDVIGAITVEFADWDKRKKAEKIMEDVREATSGIAGIHVEANLQQDGPQAEKNLEIQIRSIHPEKLDHVIEAILAGMKELGGFVDVEDSRPVPGIEWELVVDRAQASKFGLDLTSIGQSVRIVTNGLKVSEYRPNDSDEEIDIVIRYPDRYRSVDELDEVRFETEIGSIPITNFVTRKAVPKVGVINRSDQKRKMTIKANINEDLNQNAKTQELKDWITAQNFGSDVDIVFKGDDENQKESQDFLVKAFFMALSMMAVILVTQFNSFYHMFLILSAVVMSTIGVMIGLLITEQPFGIIMSGIGVIALAGIIVNNNIVLIDTFDHHVKERGRSIRDAILVTGYERLRPVLLTTVTTVLGLIPMATQMNVDFVSREVSFGAPSTQWWVSLATAVVFGLLFSTPLTLIVTPCALMVEEKAHRAKEWIKSKLKRKKKTVTI